ncbi:MAG: hypothetical protein GY724_22825 [Actinomycetia bacterium]|nr:hypothetical protein [Actinomycetes bacterium]
MGCGPVGDVGPGPSSLLVGSMGSDTYAIFELSGPPTMTHFIIVYEDRRIAINAVEGQAVFPLTGRDLGPCPPTPTLIEAWADDELLDSEVPQGFGC